MSAVCRLLQFALAFALAVYGIAVPANAMACCVGFEADALHGTAPMPGMAMAVDGSMSADAAAQHRAEVQPVCLHAACVQSGVRTYQPSAAVLLDTSVTHAAGVESTVLAVVARQTGLLLPPRVRSVVFGGAPLPLRV